MLFFKSFQDCPIEDIKKLLDATKTQDSLDAHYLDSKNTIVDSISDTDDTKVEDHQTQDKVSALLECLNENETAVICMHFGLRGYDQTTLEEVGKEVRFTRERIRQMQVSALKKLAIAAEAHHIDLALIGAA